MYNVDYAFCQQQLFVHFLLPMYLRIEKIPLDFGPPHDVVAFVPPMLK